jgi:hypothetical protein
MTRIASTSLTIALGATLALCGCAGRTPGIPFDRASAPPAPDYRQPGAWLALPGENGLERSTPPGVAPVNEDAAAGDVFFIHPTTISGEANWNAPYDASGSMVELEPAVLMGQLSVFNGCCRLYAPHYRQATLAGLKDRGATALAYLDVAAAFRQFIKERSQGRPFIIASHSQGSGHAVELLQHEVVGTPLQDRLVAAYLIGGYVPRDFAKIGLPICDGPRQTGCVLSYNASKGGRLARMVIEGKEYRWQGEWRQQGDPPAICVNPITWRADETPAEADRNVGSIPLPKAPFPDAATSLTGLTPGLTGAVCRNQMLEVRLASDAPGGFSDNLSRLAGSYHLNDYGLFYASLRQNAKERVNAWEARNLRR